MILVDELAASRNPFVTAASAPILDNSAAIPLDSGT